MAASNGSKKFMFISHFLILLILALFFVPSYGGGFSFKAVSGGWGVARTLFGFIKGLASQDKEGKEWVLCTMEWQDESNKRRACRLSQFG